MTDEEIQQAVATLAEDSTDPVLLSSIEAEIKAELRRIEVAEVIKYFLNNTSYS